MAASVCMDPLLDKDLELASRRFGVTKSLFIIKAVERALERKDPYQLLQQVRDEPPVDKPVGRSTAAAATSANLSARLRGKLKEQHEDALSNWQKFHAGKGGHCA